MARRVNLVPPSERTRTRTDFGLLILIGVAVVIVFAIVFSWYLLNGTLTDREQELADLEQQNAAIRAQLAELSQYEDIQRERVDYQEVVQSIYASRTLVSDVLDATSLVIPDNAWFENLSVTTLDPVGPSPAAQGTRSSTASDNGMSVEGNTYSFEDVAQVLVRLQLVPSLSEVTLASAGQPRGTTDPEIDVKGYTIDAIVDPPANTDAPLPITQVEVE